jgi:hypothetical protein
LYSLNDVMSVMICEMSGRRKLAKEGYAIRN